MARMSQTTRVAVREGAVQSARILLPMILETTGAGSLLDVGAGEGLWMSVGRDLLPFGVVAGVDLEGSRSVHAWDAERGEAFPSDVIFPERWPLALCLETAEHVSPAAGRHLVAELCTVARAVAWSAAIPGQGGDGHVNEQWPAYWAAVFSEFGWHLSDPWRERIWRNDRIEPWYRQNLLLARPGHVDGGYPAPLPIVHPVIWEHHRNLNWR